MITALLAFLLGFQAAPVQARGAITGQLKLSDGASAAAVRVAALPVPGGLAGLEDGPNYYNPPPPVATAMTDAQGRYRLEGIPPGYYWVLGGAAGQGTYYPSAPTLVNATVVTVAPGETATVDFRLMSALGGKVSGRVRLREGSFGGLWATLSGSKVDEFLQTPVSAEGTFDFGRVPLGTYLLSVYPPPPGLIGTGIRIGEKDQTGLEIVAPPTQTITGRIVIQPGGPIPVGLLGFYTLTADQSAIQSYLPATINPDGTFTVKLHSARHQIEIAGMPVGYSVASIRAGSTNLAQGVTVRNADIADVVVTINGPPTLPRVRGRVTGLAAERLSSVTVTLNGPVIGTLRAKVQPDGSFEFAKVVPGLYLLRLDQAPEFAPRELVVAEQDVPNLQIAVRAGRGE